MELSEDITDRKRATESLRASEVKLEQAIDTIPAMAWCNLPDGSNEFLSRRWHEYTGQSPEESHGWGWQVPFHPEDLPPLMKKWQEMLVSGESGEIEARIRRHDGVYRWFLIGAEPFRDETGKIHRWYGTSTDIEDRKRGEEQLRRSEEFRAEGQRLSRTGTFSWRLETGEIRWSAELYHIFDFDPGSPVTLELIGSRVHPDDLAMLEDMISRAHQAEGQLEYEYRIVIPDGSVKYIHLVGHTIEDAEGRLEYIGAAQDVSHRRVAEEQLRERELNLRRITQTIPGMLWSATPGGEVDYFNRPCLDFTAMTAEQASGWGWVAAIFPDDRDSLVERWRSCLASGTPLDAEARIRRFDGAYRWFLFRANPLRDQSARIVAWYGTNIDIEDRKRAEELLRARELSWRQIVDNIPGFVHTTSATGDVEFISRQTREFFGKTYEELKDWSRLGIVHPDDLPRVIEAWRKSIETGQDHEVQQRNRRADGVFRWFQSRARAVRNAEGEITAWYWLLTDIDDRKKAEEALQSNERNLSLIVDTIPGQVVRMSAVGEVELVNRQLLAFFGKNLEDIRNWSTSGIVHPEDLPRAIEVASHAFATGEPYEMEIRVRRFDGAYRWIQARGIPLRDAEGRILNWYALHTDIDDRKRAEEAVHANERNLSLIINTMPTLAWSAHPDGSAEFLNRHYLDYVGLPLEALQGWGWTAVVHPDDLNALSGAWKSIMAAGNPGETEARLRRFDGEYRWFLFRTNPMRDESGEIVKWYGTNTDINDRKTAEEALRASEFNARMIVDSIPGLVARVSPAGDVEVVNRPLLEYFGKNLQEVRNWAITDAIYPDDLSAAMDAFNSSLPAGHSFEVEHRLRRFDGVYRWFQSRGLPLREPEGRIVNWYVLLTDIEERKLVEDKLRRSEAFLAEGQHLAKMGSFSWRVAKGEIAWSEQLYRIFEFEPGTPVTLALIGSRVHPEDVPIMHEMIEMAERRASDFEFEHRIVMPDQSVKYIHMIAHGFRGEDGQFEYVGAAQDVTESEIAEQALNSARSDLAYVSRVTTLNALTASIAHEINQPLSGIITNAETCLWLLSTDVPDVAAARETAQHIIRDGNRASDVIKRLRSLYSRKESLPEPMDLNEATREVISLLLSDLQRNQVIVRQDLADDLPLITGDRIQLQQVILNLVRNASDAMSTIDDRPRELFIKTERGEDNRVRLSVRDDGIGFQPQAAAKLFEAFYTTKGDGMGIGLHVSRSIIEAHHGRLWATANDGPGATFSFAIPLQARTLGAR
jgi:PAS domain S-box-containing protein